MMALLAIADQSEATSRGWAQQLDKKSGNGRLDSKGVSWTGEVALFATQPGWLMTRESGHCS
ncbi:hypothetical protein QWY22_13155 [Planococcus liqunii]|uniref:hypothetical protein n=1 Tax=Planococcus liqunii TaxID=3058394 RepID=UPI002633E332|nr:hypothetical protein [Planococcus sp. N056]WKA49847.1 hypothetical protein QWY22_13155 [Planococcus sp. N056]